MAIMIGMLEKGKVYKVKLDWNNRAVTKEYIRDRHKGDYDESEYPNGIAIFGGRGGLVFAPYECIESIIEVVPKVRTAANMKVCPRCHGNKTFPHLSHVKNGECFQCGGAGKVW